MKARRGGWLICLGLVACGGAVSGEASPEPTREDLTFEPSLTEAPVAVSPAAPAPASKLTAARLASYRSADVVVVARLVDPQITSILEVAPPIFVHELGLAVEERVLGAGLPASPRAHFSSREHEDPFPAGERALVGLRRVRENLPKEVPEVFEVVAIDPYDAGAVAALRGSGVDDDLAIDVRQVAPVAPVQWSNDYGDGLFEITITNRGRSTLKVPGVSRTASGELDLSSLVIRDDAERALRLPGVSGVGGPELELAPGASVTRTIDVKPLGLVRPMGGYRAYYAFHVGELRASSFFYYAHELHGPQMGKI